MRLYLYECDLCGAESRTKDETPVQIGDSSADNRLRLYANDVCPNCIEAIMTTVDERKKKAEAK